MTVMVIYSAHKHQVMHQLHSVKMPMRQPMVHKLLVMEQTLMV